MALPTPIVKILSEGQNGFRHINAGCAPAVIPTFTVAAMPSAAQYPRQLIHVSNGASGSPCLAVSDGTNWNRVLIGAAVSAT